jgi:hypothetical protein
MSLAARHALRMRIRALPTMTNHVRHIFGMRAPSDVRGDVVGWIAV